MVPNWNRLGRIVWYGLRHRRCGVPPVPRRSGHGDGPVSSAEFGWRYVDYKSKLPPTWVVTYCGLTLKVRLTDFGHLGFFAEHGPHWQWLRQYVQDAGRPIRLLNAFAYTGGDVVGSRGSRGERGASGCGGRHRYLGARQRAALWSGRGAHPLGGGRRQRSFSPGKCVVATQYDAIVLDPPSFGRGSKGEVWKLERDLPAVLDLCQPGAQ